MSISFLQNGRQSSCRPSVCIIRTQKQPEKNLNGTRAEKVSHEFMNTQAFSQRLLEAHPSGWLYFR